MDVAFSTPSRLREQFGQTVSYAFKRHLATHHHYDLRLEYRGQLLSFAMPLGPSLNPKLLRFAKLMPLHNLESINAEYVKPSGEGAGIIMHWDAGTCRYHQDVRTGLRAGRLSFTLNAVKLKGDFELIQQNGNWYLRKRPDEFAACEEMTVARPNSVLTQRSLAQIYVDKAPRNWRHPAPRDERNKKIWADVMAEVERILKQQNGPTLLDLID